MIRGAFALALAAVVLAGCAVPPPASSVQTITSLPKARSFGTTHPLPSDRSNTEIAQDFIDLAFQLESGQPLPVFTRFEGPLAVAVTGQPSPALEAELHRLMARLKSEARLPVRRVNDPAKANILIEGISSRQMQRTVPQAACFVLPTRVTWDEFRRTPRSVDYNWTTLSKRTAITAFIPVDTSQQEIRDCLHEEIAQGLGPLNDLYRLEDSVFNDDNLQSILTGFDMLILRATYHPSLHSGMTRAQVAGKLPGILAALNPRGNAIPARPYRPSTTAWRHQINSALQPGTGFSRRAAADRAVELAIDAGWNDVRTGLSFYTLGRRSVGTDGEAAMESFLAAGAIYKRRPATQIHAAHVGFQVATFALSAGQWDVVISLADRYAPVARKAENAALLSDLLLAKAAAMRGQGLASDKVRQDGLAWGLYAHGTPERVSQRAAEIASLAARQGV